MVKTSSKSGTIVCQFRITRKANQKITQASKLLGLRYNAKGRLVDLCADVMVAHAQSCGLQTANGYCRLSEEQVRAIRKSKDKIIVIATVFGITQSSVCDIRSRRRYKWVK